MNFVDQIESEIKSLKIQGATNVALTVLQALTQALDESPDINSELLKQIGTRLAYVRPTEPLAQNAVRYIFGDLKSDKETIRGRVALYKSLIEDSKKEIAKVGSKLIHDGAAYVTHCHASTVTNALLTAKNEGKVIHVISTETRPLMQGRRTAQELLDGGLQDVTMIVDSAAATTLANKQKPVEAVLVGADLLSPTGFVNKIGTLGIIIIAQSYGIPVYCFSTLLKFDPRPDVYDHIELRDPKEIWAEAPQNLTIYSPAFDYTPYTEHITFITEEGPIKGDSVKESALRRYPFIAKG